MSRRAEKTKRQKPDASERACMASSRREKRDWLDMFIHRVRGIGPTLPRPAPLAAPSDSGRARVYGARPGRRRSAYLTWGGLIGVGRTCNGLIANNLFGDGLCCTPEVHGALGVQEWRGHGGSVGEGIWVGSLRCQQILTMGPHRRRRSHVRGKTRSSRTARIEDGPMGLFGVTWPRRRLAASRSRARRSMRSLRCPARARP